MRSENANFNQTRSHRAKALIMPGGKPLIEDFRLNDPVFRYLAIETEEDDTIIEAQQAESLQEIVTLLERSKVEHTDTEIHDLDTGEVLRPDFKRIYRIQRIYNSDTVVYQAAE